MNYRKVKVSWYFELADGWSCYCLRGAERRIWMQLRHTTQTTKLKLVLGGKAEYGKESN